MKSAHKLGTALALFILLSVAAYFIITGLQQAGTKPPQAGAETERVGENKTTISQEQVAASSVPITPEGSTSAATASGTTGSTSSETPPPSSAITGDAATTTTTTTTTTPGPSSPEPTPGTVSTESTTATTTAPEVTTTAAATTATKEPAAPRETARKKDDAQDGEELISTVKMYEEATRLPPIPHELSPEEIDRWNQFKAQYRRVYQSQPEEDARRAIFFGNLRFINAFNRLNTASYKLDVNHFADFTREETNELFIGPKHNWAQTNSQTPSMRILPDEALNQPVKSVDWRHLMADGGPMDQNRCLDSAIFALVASLESTINAAGGTKIKLSEQQLIDCIAMNMPLQDEPMPPRVCSGQLLVTDILNVLEKNNIKLATFNEYLQFKQAVAAGQAPPNQCVPPAPSQPNARPYVPTHVSVPRENIDEALQNSGPLVVALDASQPTFHFYKSGVYHELECSADSYNYYALLVAHNTTVGNSEPTGELDAYTIRASLGLDWGEMGHMRLASDPQKNKCLPQELAIYPNIGIE